MNFVEIILNEFFLNVKKKNRELYSNKLEIFSRINEIILNSIF